MPQTNAVPLVPNLDELIAGLREDSPASALLGVFASATDLDDARRRLRVIVENWTTGEEPAR